VRGPIPLAVAFLSGLFMVITFFSPHPEVVRVSGDFFNWVSIVSGFTILLGVVSIASNNLAKVRRRQEGWPYAVVLLIFLAIMLAGGLFQGIESGTVYDVLFTQVQAPMMTTMFSMLAFFIASAAYRAFRARTLQATLLLVTAVIVMLGRIPVGQAIYDRLPEVATWIMVVPNTAVQRGIIIGAALGGAATALRIVLGLDRTYMGRG
jgi:predicted MFS family arabinose efflux permease